MTCFSAPAIASAPTEPEGAIETLFDNSSAVRPPRRQATCGLLPAAVGAPTWGTPSQRSHSIPRGSLSKGPQGFYPVDHEPRRSHHQTVNASFHRTARRHFFRDCGLGIGKMALALSGREGCGEPWRPPSTTCATRLRPNELSSFHGRGAQPTGTL